MIDARVNEGIRLYDLNYQQARHKENQEAIQKAREEIRESDRKMQRLWGSFAVLVPIATAGISWAFEHYLK